jgi:hypothetical protein
MKVVLLITIYFVGYLQAGDDQISLEWAKSKTQTDGYELKFVKTRSTSLPKSTPPPFYWGDAAGRPGRPKSNQNQPTKVVLRRFGETKLDLSRSLQSYSFPGCFRQSSNERDTTPKTPITISPDGWTNERGLKWASGRSLTNTCAIDPFLNNFMFMVFRDKNFVKKHLRLPLDRGETALKEISRLTLARDFYANDHKQDHSIKEAWVNIAMNRLTTTRAVLDCKGSENEMVLDYLKDSSRLAMFHTCGCRVTEANNVAEDIGYSEMTPEKLKVLVKLPVMRTPVDEKVSDRSRQMCRTCMQDYRFYQAVVGNCTWFVKFKPADTFEAMDPLKWPRFISFGNVEAEGSDGISLATSNYQLVYASYTGPLGYSHVDVNEDLPYPVTYKPPTTSTHLVSFHFFDGKIYLYDDLSKSGKMKRIRSPVQYVVTRQLKPETVMYVKLG